MIRLQRVGRKNDPSFRLVVMPKQKDSQSGKVVEILGSYNARQGKPQVKAERVQHWIKMGAQVSGTAHNILVDEKVITGKKKNVLPKRKPEAKAAAPAEVKVEEQVEAPKDEPTDERVAVVEGQADTPVDETPTEA